ncbi:hypothetical protein LMG26685_02916 [Achromobacter mucicolens]|nr:hypothetical protein LMG26685_02916 [Achromobacter mucicolens]
MTSPVKLPPLPPIPWNVLGGIANDCVSAEAIHDYAAGYAEQAVREALEHVVQTIERMSQEEFERPGLKWPTHMAYHQAIQSIRVVIPGSGHKPAPMDTSSGHSAEKDPPC